MQKMLKSAEKCQMLSLANEMEAASLKAGCKGTMMWGLFAIFDKERGFKKAKGRCNLSKGWQGAWFKSLVQNAFWGVVTNPNG